MGDEFFVEHPDGTRSDAGLWADILEPHEMPARADLKKAAEDRRDRERKPPDE